MEAMLGYLILDLGDHFPEFSHPDPQSLHLCNGDSDTNSCMKRITFRVVLTLNVHHIESTHIAQKGKSYDDCRLIHKETKTEGLGFTLRSSCRSKGLS